MSSHPAETALSEHDAVVRVSSEEALAFAAALLQAHGVTDEDAATVAGCLIRADLRGVDSHGLMFLPLYLDRLRRGLIKGRPNIIVERVTPVVASIDGDDGFGFVTATRGMDEAMSIAREFGIGVACVRRSTHFGMAASFVLRAVEAGYIGLVFTNASPAIPPWGGSKAVFGTSPLAAGAPAGRAQPFVLDMSPAVAARGKIRRSARRGEPIPLGQALDVEGRPTTDATAALAGVLLPIGGPKGAALSMLMDILGGLLTGAAYAGQVHSQFSEVDECQNVGHFLLAIRPDLILPLEEYEARMEALVNVVHACPPADGFSEVTMPGERSARLERERRVSGIPYKRRELAALVAIAAEAGVAGPPEGGA
jgi:LDH2 family malate/lactate/ureidoglycolate dehydrogenase